MLGGLRGQRGVFVLLLGHLGGFKQLQHAQHPIHGRAQFMAHHGQELGFRVVGALGFLVLDQFGHGLLLFPAGLLKAAGQVVDMPGQAAQFGIVDDGQRGDSHRAG